MSPVDKPSVEKDGFASLLCELDPMLSLHDAQAADRRLNTFITTIFEIDAQNSQSKKEKAS